MLKQTLYILPLLFIGLVVSGCAIGNKYKIADVEAKLQATGSVAIVVASLDHRPPIVDKSSPETYVGMVRGGYGNPFDATTKSDLPFSFAVSKAICNALNRKGFTASSLPVKPNMTEQQVVDLLLAKNKDKAMLVIIKQWESDSFYNLNIGYDFLLKVFNRDGRLLATSEAKDSVAVSGSIMTGSLELSKKEVPATFRKAIETLLNTQDVMQALADN